MTTPLKFYNPSGIVSAKSGVSNSGYRARSTLDLGYPPISFSDKSSRNNFMSRGKSSLANL